MAFKQKVRESYHFPQNNGNNARLITQNNDELTKESDNKLIVSENQEKFNLYPNPNNGTFTLNYEIPNGRTVELQLINLMGTIVYQTLLENTTTIKKINATFLSNGIYFLSVNDINGSPLFKSKLSIIK